MKKLIAIFLLVTTLGQSLHAATASNPRNTLITAMARNDFGTVTKALSQITDMSFDEKQQYVQMADQIIASAIYWNSKHAFLPEMGKNLLASLGYSLATGLSASFATVILGLAAEQEYYDKSAKKPAIAATVLYALAGYFGYRSISELINAWMKPSNRLENALRIRDAIFHYEVSSANLSYLGEGNYSTAVGNIALGHDEPEVSENPEVLSYNVIGYQSYALCTSESEETQG